MRAYAYAYSTLHEHSFIWAQLYMFSVYFCDEMVLVGPIG